MLIVLKLYKCFGHCLIWISFLDYVLLLCSQIDFSCFVGVYYYQNMNMRRKNSHIKFCVLSQLNKLV